MAKSRQSRLRRAGLARAREAAGLTQEAFAVLAGVEVSTVVRWESGDTTPLPGKRPRIARVLGVDLQELERLLVPEGSRPAEVFPGQPEPGGLAAIAGVREAVAKLAAEYEARPSTGLVVRAAALLERVEGLRAEGLRGQGPRGGGAAGGSRGTLIVGTVVSTGAGSGVAGPYGTLADRIQTVAGAVAQGVTADRPRATAGWLEGSVMPRLGGVLGAPGAPGASAPGGYGDPGVAEFDGAGVSGVDDADHQDTDHQDADVVAHLAETSGTFASTDGPGASGPAGVPGTPGAPGALGLPGLPAVSGLGDAARTWSAPIPAPRDGSATVLLTAPSPFTVPGLPAAPQSPGRWRRDLDIAEAEAALLAGRLLWDATGRRDASTAEELFDRAHRRASRAGDAVLQASALLRAAYLGLYGGDPRAGVRRCVQAAAVAAPVSPALTALARLHAAEGHALLGRAADCDRALAGALEALVRSDADDPAQGACPPRTYPRLAGAAHLALGRHAEARAALTEAALRYEPGKALAVILGHLALACLGEGDAPAAVRHLRAAVDLAAVTRSAGARAVVFRAGRDIARVSGPARADALEIVDQLLGMVAGG